MKTLRLLVPASLVLLAASCASVSADKPAGGPKSAAKADEGGDTDELQAKLDKAQIKLEIARLDAANGEAAAARSLASAELEAEMAAQALANFREVQQPLDAAEQALSLDRSSQRVKESQQELEELEKMYAQEEFADLTKELVLDRGRSQLEMAKRSHDLTLKRAAQERDYAWPRRERELADKVAASQRALEEAKSRAAKGALERKLALMDAEEAVSKAREALEKQAGDGA